VAIVSQRIDFYPHGVKLSLKKGQTGSSPCSSVRGDVSFFSDKSKKRLSWVYSQGDWKSMITLTYHLSFPDYVAAKGHLNAVLQRCRYIGLRYLWVVEFQGRGFPHYHIWFNRELSRDEQKSIIKTWLSQTSEHNKFRAAKFHLHPSVYTPWDVRLNLNYAVKYAEKQQQKWLPVDVKSFGRWWGSSVHAIRPIESEEISYDIHDGTDFMGIFNRISPEKQRVLTNFRRNVKRAVYHWSRRRKKNIIDRNTNAGWSYVFIDSRMECIKKLWENSKKILKMTDSEIYNYYESANADFKSGSPGNF